MKAFLFYSYKISAIDDDLSTVVKEMMDRLKGGAHGLTPEEAVGNCGKGQEGSCRMDGRAEKKL